MKLLRINVRKTKEIPNNSDSLNKAIHAIIKALENSKANNIQTNGSIITFKNNAWEWRIDGDLMGVLKEGKFELSETRNGVIVILETYYSILNDFLLFPPIAIVTTLYFNDLRGLLLLSGTVLGIILKKIIVSTKLEDIFEKL